MNDLPRILTVLLAAVLAFQAGQVHAASRRGLARRLAALEASPALKNAPWGLSVKYVDTGKTVAAVRADKSLVPASTMKVFVAAASLAALGPDHRFRTGLYRAGAVDADGTLHGDLVLKGGGDPTLGSTLMAGTRSLDELLDSWVKAVKDAGIRRVRGSVTADNRLFSGPPDPGSWAWEDLGNYYAAPADALSLHDNLYTLFFAPGKAAGELARFLRAEPQPPQLDFDNEMLTGPAGSGDNGYVYCVPGQHRATLRGTLPAGTPEYSIQGAIPEPSMFAAGSLMRRLEAAGVAVSGPSAYVGDSADLTGAALLAEEISPTLTDIARVTIRRSVNLYAEMLARALALKAGRPGSAQEGLAAIRDFLRSTGVDLTGLRLADASGLSRQDAVPPETFVDFLAAMSRHPSFPAFRDTLAVPGPDDVTGKVRGFGQGALDGCLHFKSGFMTGARSYCGYLKDAEGRLLAFAFIVNHHASSRAEVEALLTDVLAGLAGEK